MATCGNGAKTGKEAIAAMLRLILRVLTVGLTGLIVAVAGTASGGSVARRFATTARRAFASITSAFASPSLSNNLFKMF